MPTIGPSSLSASDRAMLLAFRAWRIPNNELPWVQLAPAWSLALQAAWDREIAPIDPEKAWSALNRQHAAEAVFQADNVHPSWLTPALQGESPSVVRAIIAHSPAPMKDRLGEAFKLDPQSFLPDGPTHPDILAWAQSFWAERLVGGAPARAGRSSRDCRDRGTFVEGNDPPGPDGGAGQARPGGEARRSWSFAEEFEKTGVPR